MNTHQAKSSKSESQPTAAPTLKSVVCLDINCCSIPNSTKLHELDASLSRYLASISVESAPWKAFKTGDQKLCELVGVQDLPECRSDFSIAVIWGYILDVLLKGKKPFLVLMSNDRKFISTMMELKKRGLESLLICDPETAKFANSYGVNTKQLSEILRPDTVEKFNPEDYHTLFTKCSKCMMEREAIKPTKFAYRLVMSAEKTFSDSEWDTFVEDPRIAVMIKLFEAVNFPRKLFDVENPSWTSFSIAVTLGIYGLLYKNRGTSKPNIYLLAKYLHSRVTEEFNCAGVGEILEFLALVEKLGWITCDDDGCRISDSLPNKFPFEQTFSQQYAEDSCVKKAISGFYKRRGSDKGDSPAVVDVKCVPAIAPVTSQVPGADSGYPIIKSQPFSAEEKSKAVCTVDPQPSASKAEEASQKASAILISSVSAAAKVTERRSSLPWLPSPHPDVLLASEAAPEPTGIDESVAEIAFEYYTRFDPLPQFNFKSCQVDGELIFECTVHVPLETGQSYDDLTRGVTAHGRGVTREESKRKAASHACTLILEAFPGYKFPEMCYSNVNQ